MPVIRAAKVVVIDADGKALLLWRSNTHPHMPLRADLPGGIIEDDETFELGLSREIKEETGLDVDPDDLSLLYTVSHDYFGKPISRLLYLVRINTRQPEIMVSWEHDHYKWVSLTGLKGLEKPDQQGVDYANERNLWVEI